MRPSSFTRLALCIALGLCGSGMAAPGSDARAAAATTAQSAITLTVDCPNCGPGQPFPHDCPRVGREKTTTIVEPSLVTGYLEKAKANYRSLAAVNGIALPPLGTPASRVELDGTLGLILSEARTAIEGMERESAEVATTAARARANAQDLAKRATELTTEIARLKKEIVAIDAQIVEEQRRAMAARDDFIAIQKQGAALREDIRQTRNRLFPRLQQAAQQGWLLPPSSYRQIPSPLPLKDLRSPTPEIVQIPLNDLAPRAPGRGVEPSTTTPLRSRVGETPVAMNLDQNIEAKLNELAALELRARVALAGRAEAQRSAETARNEIAVQQANVAVLEPERITLASRLQDRERQFPEVRRLAASELARLDEAHLRDARAWIEAALYRITDRAAEQALAQLLAEGPNAARLAALRQAAETAARLSADPTAAIANLAATANNEVLGEIRREVATVGDKLQLRAASNLPPPLSLYFGEARP